MNRISALVFGLMLLCQVTTAFAQVALLDSASTREFFRRHYPECTVSTYLGADEYQRYFRGWEFVLKEMNVPYTLISDADLTASSLADFTVLILSNIASLDTEQTRAIHHWTIGGGHLLATFGTGYKSVDEDPREADLLRAQKGDTFGLHQLWHDPVSKLFGSEAVFGSVDVQISRIEGPTAGVPGGFLGYGALANLLIHRPPQAQDVLAWVRVGNTITDYPAIISTRSGRGLTVYYSFAPEYIVSKEFEGTALMPDLPVCPDGQDWSGRSTQLRLLMRNTISYLLN